MRRTAPLETRGCRDARERDDERVELAERALELAGDAIWASHIVEMLGLIAWRQEDLVRTRQLFEQVVETATRSGDTAALTTALILLALLAAEGQNYAHALERLSD